MHTFDTFNIWEIHLEYNWKYIYGISVHSSWLVYSLAVNLKHNAKAARTFDSNWILFIMFKKKKMEYVSIKS